MTRNMTFLYLKRRYCRRTCRKIWYWNDRGRQGLIDAKHPEAIARAEWISNPQLPLAVAFRAGKVPADWEEALESPIAKDVLLDHLSRK